MPRTPTRRTGGSVDRGALCAGLLLALLGACGSCVEHPVRSGEGPRATVELLVLNETSEHLRGALLCDSSRATTASAFEMKVTDRTMLVEVETSASCELSLMLENSIERRTYSLGHLYRSALGSHGAPLRLLLGEGHASVRSWSGPQRRGWGITEDGRGLEADLLSRAIDRHVSAVFEFPLD